MPKTLTETTISTRHARSKLGVGTYWRGIDAEVHLGYRKGSRGGRWLVRWYLGDQAYRQETIGSADDAIEADGVNCFSFDQAKAKAVKHVANERWEAIESAKGPVPTVGSVVRRYIEERDAKELAQLGCNGRKRDAFLRLTKHVLSCEKLADTPLHKLSENDLHEWRSSLPVELARSTVRRIANDFKAALNAGAIRHRSRFAAEIFPVIRNGLRTEDAQAVVARDKQALPDADIRRIIAAAETIDREDNWEGDLYRLIVVLAATGARFSQVIRMMFGDVQRERCRLMVPVSRKGRGQKRSSHIAIHVGNDVLNSLLPATKGRSGDAPLLERWRHVQVPGSNGNPLTWIRDRRAPWYSAAELTRPWRRIIAEVGLADDVVPYALRHSSVVRQLRAGLPVRLVAALHDTSADMIERHYAAAIIDALGDLAAGAVVPLITDTSGNVVRLQA